MLGEPTYSNGGDVFGDLKSRIAPPPLKGDFVEKEPSIFDPHLEDLIESLYREKDKKRFKIKKAPYVYDKDDLPWWMMPYEKTEFEPEEAPPGQWASSGGRIGYKDGNGVDDKTLTMSRIFWKKALENGTIAPGTSFNEFLKTGLASGGRIEAQEGGLMNLGGMEKDYRQEGGFVPLGGKEKADDVPARLSKNEFVFTADAVRAAGGGDIDQGAEVMENVMENLEAGGEISEESQGLEGARGMFANAQQLEKRII